jgi:Flp pilus assembly protein TadG
VNRSNERGSVTVFVTVMTIALIFVAGLVLDGGRILNARRDAANTAESAARAGAQELDEDAMRRTGAAVIDPDRAVARAEAFLAANGYAGTASATPTTVTVTVSLDISLLILGIGGMADAEVTGTGSAEPQRGITEAQP